MVCRQCSSDDVGISSVRLDYPQLVVNPSEALWATSSTIRPPTPTLLGVHLQTSPEPDSFGAISAPLTLSGIQQQWLAGYRAFNGPAYYELHFVRYVIPCESGWRLDPGNPLYLGLMQWLPSSWYAAADRTGLYDWLDPYAQGANTAVWVRLTDPGTQWPDCWFTNPIGG